MSDATFTLDQRKTLAEIDQLYTNTHKLLIEATKMTAETVKLQGDARMAPWQMAFARNNRRPPGQQLSTKSPQTKVFNRARRRS